MIVFGQNAEVEIPPVDFNIQLGRKVESLLDRDYTNLSGAMQRAMAMFPHDSAKRIVLVTDGNQNVGDALRRSPRDCRRRREHRRDAGAARSAERRGGRNVRAAARYPPQSAVRSPRGRQQHIDGCKRQRQEREGAHSRSSAKRASGKRRSSMSRTKSSRAKRCFRSARKSTSPIFIRTKPASFPMTPQNDAIAQNNVATAFTHVQGKGLVLLIENWETPGEFDHLVERLRDEGLEVVVQPSNRLFTSLPELQRYDTVILADVPRASGDDAASVSSFSDEQIKMLVRNTEELGCGLIMIGGPNSFGAGGWTNTELEKAMPVDFQIKSAKVVPVGALVLNMHASEIPQANYWQKVICQEAIKALGPRDYCGARVLRQHRSMAVGAIARAAWSASAPTGR